MISRKEKEVGIGIENPQCKWIGRLVDVLACMFTCMYGLCGGLRKEKLIRYLPQAS